MPAERRQPQKSRQLPFKPPRPRTSTSNAGPSNQKSSGPNSKTKNNTIEASLSSSSSKRPHNSTSSRQKPPQSPETSAESAPEQESASESETRRQSRESPLLSEEADYVLAEIVTGNKTNNDVTSSEPTIPPKLLTKLLHHHFQNGKTKITKDANDVVAKYVDVFVRESLARAAYERSESEGGTGSGGRGAVGDGFLEVEDLEKMAPQLLLDF